jgi:hypothetical protein
VGPTAPAVAPSARIGPDASVEARDASGGSAQASSDASARPAFGPAPPTTPGAILCGDTLCRLGTEVCCENLHAGVAQCVPRPSNPDAYACGGVRDAIDEKHCDEMADCPGGKSCCATWGCSGGCPPVHVCTDVPCWHGPLEQCLPGGACSARFRCVVEHGMRTGTCRYERAGVACGDKRCSGEEPLCCWNAKTRRGTCAADCPEDPGGDTWRLACTSPDDCGGYPCADFAISPTRPVSCMGSYNVPDQSGVVFCRSIRDCPKMNMLGKPRACVPDPTFPGAAKTCRFESR